MSWGSYSRGSCSAVFPDEGYTLLHDAHSLNHTSDAAGSLFRYHFGRAGCGSESGPHTGRHSESWPLFALSRLTPPLWL